MKDYFIEIEVKIPYPKQYQFTEKGSSFGVAISRGLKKMREQINGKKVITEVVIRAKKL